MTAPPDGFAILFTGLPAAGKSTLAAAVQAWLERETRRQVVVLDGDAVRREQSSDLGYARADREEHARRVGLLAADLVHSGHVVLCALITPYESTRMAFRTQIESDGPCLIVHVSTPVHVCEGRDPKGLYARARAGAVLHFTGVSDPYEPPPHPDLSIDTSGTSITDAAGRVAALLRARRLI